MSHSSFPPTFLSRKKDPKSRREKNEMYCVGLFRLLFRPRFLSSRSFRLTFPRWETTRNQFTVKRGRHEATASSPPSWRGKARITRAAGGNNTRVSGEKLHSFSRLLFPSPANFPPPVADQRILSLLQLFATRLLLFSRRQPSSLRKDSYVVDVVATDRENKATSCPRFHLFTAEKSSYTRG